MTHGIWVGRPVWAYVGALCLAGSAAIASCYNGDQSCSEAYNPNDLGDHCPYGPPGGPKPGDFPSNCPSIPDPDDAACATVTWSAVHAVLIAPDKGNCTGAANGGCHSGPIGVNLPAFVQDPNNPNDPADDGSALLNSLAGFTGTFGIAYPTVQGTDAVPRLYYDRDDPASSWWLCNLRGDAGSLMPQGKPRMSQDDIALLELWLACGATDDPAP